MTGTPPVAHVDWKPCFRIIPSRFPPIGLFDRVAAPAFNAPFPVGLYSVGNRFDFVGVLVPSGLGPWRLKPRAPLDLTPR